MNLSHRSYSKELLDSDNIPFSDIQQNMKELDFINTWLGGHSITIDGFKQLAGNRKHISVCEIGCGGGDNLIAIKKWCKQNGIIVELIGVDIKKECIDFAISRKTFNPSDLFFTSDYKLVQFDNKPDIIFSSLFCHHFTDEELIDQFRWMKQNSTIGFFVNDLERNRVAYYSIKWLTVFFSKSYLVKNDAPLSVSRGFRKNELMSLLYKAGLKGFTVFGKWAFRYLIIYTNHE